MHNFDSHWFGVVDSVCTRSFYAVFGTGPLMQSAMGVGSVMWWMINWMAIFFMWQNDGLEIHHVNEDQLYSIIIIIDKRHISLWRPVAFNLSPAGYDWAVKPSVKLPCKRSRVAWSDVKTVSVVKCHCSSRLSLGRNDVVLTLPD